MAGVRTVAPLGGGPCGPLWKRESVTCGAAITPNRRVQRSPAELLSGCFGGSYLHARGGGFQRVGAMPQRLAFLRRHFGLECLNDALAAEEARQGQRGAVLRLVGADRNDRALVTQNNFRDPRRDHADP